MSILEIRDLAYDYVTKAGAVHALKHATASFEAGTVYAIVGRSGSGKSTFMSLLAGLDVPKSGRILYNGTDLAGLDRDRYRREHVGMVFQSYYLLPQLTAVENVELALELSGKKEGKRNQVHAEQNQHPVKSATKDISNHGALLDDTLRRDRTRKTCRTPNKKSTINPAITPKGQRIGRFHARTAASRSAASMPIYIRRS